MISRESLAILNDEDHRLLREVREIVKERDRNPSKQKKIITEKEMLGRRRLGLSCNAYVTIEEMILKYRIKR